jgi:hypothetical protein
MTAREIITRVRECGGYFVIVDGGLRLRNPRRVTAQLVAEIRAHRAAVKSEIEAKRGPAR